MVSADTITTRAAQTAFRPAIVSPLRAGKLHGAAALTLNGEQHCLGRVAYHLTSHEPQLTAAHNEPANEQQPSHTDPDKEK